MNTPTPITAAHLALVRDMAAQGQYLSRSIEHYAQEIADSEARATAAIRAEVERLKAVPPTASCGELSCDECNARTAALTAERDQLLQQVDLLKFANHYHRQTAEAELAVAKAGWGLCTQANDNHLSELNRVRAELAKERARLEACMLILNVVDESQPNTWASQASRRAWIQVQIETLKNKK